MAVETPVLPEKIHRAAQPWGFFLFHRSPWPPILTGIVFGAGLLFFMVLLELSTGRPQAILAGQAAAKVGCTYLLGDYRIGIVGIILLAYAMTARYILARWTYRTAVHLGSADFVDADSLAEIHWWGFLPGLAGGVLCLTLAIDIAERDVEWTHDYWIIPHIFNWLWCIPFGWTGMRLIFALTGNAILISRVARNIKVRDLDDTEPLDAAIRHGTRSALLSLMLLGLVSVHFIDPGMGLPAVMFLVALFLTGVLISTLPVVGVVQVLLDKRDENLARLRKELDSEERELLSKAPDYEPGRIGDIVALEKRLEEWRIPVLRVSVLARLLAYTIIGFLSWLGAAAVSVVVENFFGF